MAYLVDVINRELQYSPQNQGNYHQPMETFAPQIQDARQFGYNYTGPTYIINSPEASVEKKGTLSMSSSPSQSGAWEIPTNMTQPQTNSESNSTGLDWTLLGLAGLGIVGAYLLISSGGIQRVTRRKRK